MQITVSAGGKTWVVDEGRLISWLESNARQNLQPKNDVYKETDAFGNETGRVVLNESW